jgi:5'-methylthioinosine phosphorylase
MFGIIGGSGLAQLPGLEAIEAVAISTPWGAPSAPLRSGSLDGARVIFLPRHGQPPVIAPHEINYRANLWALREAGVRCVLAVATVGGIAEGLEPGSLVVPDQLIDYTSGRASTFGAPAGEPVRHVDFTQPYDAALRARMLAAAQALGEPVLDGGTYGCTQGPRLETAAEIRRLARDGCTIVGMTGMPEAVLARELGIAYAVLAVVVNDAAGIGQSGSAVAIESLGAVLQGAMDRVLRIVGKTIAA